MDNGMPKSCLLEPEKKASKEILSLVALYVVSFVRIMEWKRRYMLCEIVL